MTKKAKGKSKVPVFKTGDVVMAKYDIPSTITKGKLYTVLEEPEGEENPGFWTYLIDDSGEFNGVEGDFLKLVRSKINLDPDFSLDEILKGQELVK